MITLSPFWRLIQIFDFRFLINHNHVTLCRWTLIFRFLRVVWPELSDENLKNNFARFNKISVLSRFGANINEACFRDSLNSKNHLHNFDRRFFLFVSYVRHSLYRIRFIGLENVYGQLVSICCPELSRLIAFTYSFIFAKW